MILNPTYYDKDILQKMKDIVEEIEFDIIKIIHLNTSKEYLYEAFSLDSSSITQSVPDFTTANTDKDIISLLSEFKNSVILNEQETLLNNRRIKKHSDSFSTEIYVPTFDENNALTGFIYYAKLEPSHENIRSNMNYINNIKKLLQLVENKQISAKNTEKLYDTVLLLCEVIYSNKPDMINRLYSIFYWAKEIAEKMNLSEFQIHKLQLAILIHDFGRINIDQKIFDSIDLNKASTDALRSYISHSYEIALKLKNIYEIYDIPDIILYSMQRVDGAKFPEISSSDQIPLLSRIIYISKAVTYMLENTPHKKAYTIEKIISNINNGSGTIFDPHISEILIPLLLKKRDTIEDIFTGIGNYVTINLVLDTMEQHNIWGSIRKIENLYEFRPSTELPQINSGNIKSCDIFLINNDDNIKFTSDILSYSLNSIVFSNLKPQEDENLFYIKWSLNGTIITKEKEKYDIITTTIGGRFIDFYTFTDESETPITAGIISIDFFDEGNTYIPGIITFHQTTADKTYYRLNYHNLSDTNQRKIFSAIFKKQVERKRQIHINSVQ